MKKRAQMLLPFFALQLIAIIIFFIVLLVLLSLTKNVSIAVNEFDKDTAFYLATRRLVSTADCFATEEKGIVAVETGDRLLFNSRVYPNIVDEYKLYDYENFNCMRKDFYDKLSDVNQGVWDANEGTGAAFKYRLKVYDFTDKTFVYDSSDNTASSLIARINKERNNIVVNAIAAASDYVTGSGEEMQKEVRWNVKSGECPYAFYDITVENPNTEQQFGFVDSFNSMLITFLAISDQTTIYATKYDVPLVDMTEYVLFCYYGKSVGSPVFEVSINGTVVTNAVNVGLGSHCAVLPKANFVEGAGTYMIGIRCTNCVDEVNPSDDIGFVLYTEEETGLVNKTAYTSTDSGATWTADDTKDYYFGAQTRNMETWNQEDLTCDNNQESMRTLIPTYIKTTDDLTLHPGMIVFDSCVVKGTNYTGRPICSFEVEAKPGEGCG